MDNKNISTKLGTVILVIITITVGVFVWVYEKDQGQSTFLNNDSVSLQKSSAKLTSNTVDQKTVVNTYTSKEYDFVFEYPKNLIITPESTNNNIGISDEKNDHWLYSIVITDNNQNLSLDKALNEILATPPYKNREVSTNNITLDSKPATRFSFKSNDYGNTGVIFVTQKNIIIIRGDDSSAVLKKNFETFLDTFRLNAPK